VTLPLAKVSGAAAFFLPILCYAYIAYYGAKGHVPSYKRAAEA
jgi:fucose permease